MGFRVQLSKPGPKFQAVRAGEVEIVRDDGQLQLLLPPHNAFSARNLPKIEMACFVRLCRSGF